MLSKFRALTLPSTTQAVFVNLDEPETVNFDEPEVFVANVISFATLPGS